MATINAHLLALESLVSTDEIVGLEVCSYEDWPAVLPPDWVETSPGSEIWSTPAPELEVKHGNA